LRTYFDRKHATSLARRHMGAALSMSTDMETPTGVQRTALHGKLRVCGRCTSPVPRTLSYRDRPMGPHIGKVTGVVASLDRPTFNVDVEARCRRCGECLKARAALWRGRAKAEIQGGFRNWFGTLTLTPHAQFRALSAARLAAAREGLDFDKLDILCTSDTTPLGALR